MFSETYKRGREKSCSTKGCLVVKLEVTTIFLGYVLYKAERDPF